MSYKVVATSDLHGNLPQVPECDLLIIAGDLCPVWNHDLKYQRYWLDTDFRQWLDSVPAKDVIAIAGNHDFLFQYFPEQVPQLRWVYLQDRTIVWNGYKIHGSPWQPNLQRWAFYLDKETIQFMWDRIPIDTDILITHTPPKNYCDKIIEGEHVGCPVLLKRLYELRGLKMLIVGHIHEAYGSAKLGDVDIFNVSYLQRDYTGTNPLVEFTLDEKNIG